MDFQHIDFGAFLIQYVVLLFSLSIHESAHAWTADYFGDYTARYLGRVSLNPLVHIDPVGTVIFPLLQLFTRIPLIGWAKPVPVNPAHLQRPRRDNMIISAAGPLSNLLAGISFLFILIALKQVYPETVRIMIYIFNFNIIPHQYAILSPIVAMLCFGLMMNFALAIFNLIPIPPLDGSGILYGFLPYRAAQAYEGVGRFGFILLYAMMFFGILRLVYKPVEFIISLIFL